MYYPVRCRYSVRYYIYTATHFPDWVLRIFETQKHGHNAFYLLYRTMGGLFGFQFWNLDFKIVTVSLHFFNHCSRSHPKIARP